MVGTRNIAPAPAPVLNHHHHHHSLTFPSPSTTTAIINTINHPSPQQQQNSRFPIDFSPPLIAMVVVIIAAFLVITYSRLISRHLLRVFRRYRRWRRRIRYLPSISDGVLDSPPPLFDSPEGFHIYSPYGLEESVIKTIPLSVYTKKSINSSFNKHTRDCAVCLLEFEENDYVRTLPVCSHAFHVDCIDIWLRSHANCPLCRAGVFRAESPFIPVMAARIRPSLDDTILHSMISLDIPVIQPQSNSITSTTTTATAISTVTEITPCIEEPSPRRNSSNFNLTEDRFNGNESLMLKRSYSFGFERSLASERMLVTEPATTSPWRYRRGSFWSKRPSPFGYATSKPRVFSFTYYRGMKSPAFFRRRGGFFPLSERFSSIGGGSSRRSKSMTSPMFMRSSVAAFSSSRLRCGDPEALLSPERFNRR